MTDMEIVKENEWLIKKVSSMFYHVDKEDLYQAGVLGILKAIPKYHNQGTTKFSTFAYSFVFGEMYQMVYKNQAIKVSRDTLRAYQRIEMARSSLAQKLARIPSYDEVACFLEMDPMVVEQIVVSGSYLMTSLDEKNNESERSYYETIPAEESIPIDDVLTLQEGISTLNPEEQKIIQYRYFNDMTQQETAEKMNMTQVMVSRYERKATHKIRSFYDGIAA